MFYTVKSVLIPALLIGFSAAAQHSGNANYNGSNIISHHTPRGVDLNLNTGSNYFSSGVSFNDILEANVMINVKASSYVAIFSVTQHGKSMWEADSMMNLRLNAFTENLGKKGFTGKQVFIDVISMIPTYEYEVINKSFSRTLNEKPSGFEIKKNVHVTFFKHEQASDLMSLAAMSEIYDLVKVDYVIDNIDALYQQLRIEALAILANKKAAYEQAGISIRVLKAGEKFASVYPFERYAEYYASKTGVAPSFVSNAKKGVSVQYNYSEKNKTMYYEKVPENQFDKVINPLVDEPVVQVYLSMKTQFVIYDPETEKETKEYLKKQRGWEEREKEIQLGELAKPKAKKPAVQNMNH